MTYQLGIDLGTTYTAAAVHRDGRAEMVTLGNRASSTPSVVYLAPDETILTGEAASRRAMTEPGRVAREFKRRVGDPTPVLLAGSPYSAEALMARMLRWVVDATSDVEGGPPDAVAVSHPANWGTYKIDLLLQGARLADLDDVVTVTEPVAAAVHYAASERIDPGELVAVYDLGGGTFDAAVLRRTDTSFEVLGRPEGIERLGGIDFDQAVFAHVAAALDGALDEIDTDDPASLAALARLRQDCVEAKEALSSDSEVSIPVLLPRLQTEVRLTRGELEAMIRPALADSIGALRRALRSAEVEPEDLSAVLLVGGSSRIPLVSELVGSELRRPVAVDAHPKHAVALGTALVAAAEAREARAVPAVAAAPATAGTPPPVEPAPPPPAARGRSRTWLVGAAAALAVVALAGAAFALGGDDGDGNRAAAEPPAEAPTTTTTSTTSPPTTTTAEPVPATTDAGMPLDDCPVPEGTAFACVDDVYVEGDELVATFSTYDIEPFLSAGELPSGTRHLHFFFDTTHPDDAGTQSSSPGVWRIWDDRQPFRGPTNEVGGAGYFLDEIPDGAEAVCVLVADHQHRATPGTGNCRTLPPEAR